MRLWVSQIDVIAQEQQSESGGGVTGTQHAPVESQIETVPSVGAQLAPGRHTGLRWHQADTQAATQQTEQPLRGLLSSHTSVCGPGFCTGARWALPLCSIPRLFGF